MRTLKYRLLIAALFSSLVLSLSRTLHFQDGQHLDFTINPKVSEWFATKYSRHRPTLDSLLAPASHWSCWPMEVSDWLTLTPLSAASLERYPGKEEPLQL